MSLKVIGILCAFVTVAEGQNWSGHLESYTRWVDSRCFYCDSWYRYGGCYRWKNYDCRTRSPSSRCANGWTHRGDYNCSTPICYPDCGKHGVCKSPNTCDCRGTANTQFCQTLTCSYYQPCYPGNCYNYNQCNCTQGFEKESSSQIGCLKMSSTNIPDIGRSGINISHIRETDKSTLYYFQLEGDDPQNYVWSNKRIFNRMAFVFETTFAMPEEIPEKPAYVHDIKLGIVGGTVRMRILDYFGREHPTKKMDYPCPASSSIKENPASLFTCNINEAEFNITVEHADILEVTFEAENGGSRQINAQGSIRHYEYFTGQKDTRKVNFKYDFQAPKHCKETGFDKNYTDTDCNNATILTIREEFTKKPVQLLWKGWSDDRYGSQMWMYYIELHRLVTKDATKQLTELAPLKPMGTQTVKHSVNVTLKADFIPTEPGMYSVLLEVRDVANNSRIARRFVLFDNVSDVEISTDRQLHIASAAAKTGYHWQSQGTEGQNTNIEVNWTGVFMNKFHEDHYLLNSVKQYPIQFQEIADDGILSTRKLVEKSLDDYEGERQLNDIPNIHGIVKFEYQYNRNTTQEASDGQWMPTSALAENQRIVEIMNTGDQLKIWVRATDALRNQKIASTYVTTDFTEPIITDADNNQTTFMTFNVEDPMKIYNYSSRIKLLAHDPESAVRHIGLIFVLHTPGDDPDITVEKVVDANTDTTLHPINNPLCARSLDTSTCFLRNQSVYFDNCWLMVPSKSQLSFTSATVTVVVYNQAMLTKTLTFEIRNISELTGLQQYTGPDNIRIENVQADSFRLAWDSPKVQSCYGSADVIIVLFIKRGGEENELLTRVASSGTTFFDFGGLEPETDYTVKFSTALGGGGKTEALELKAQTGAIETPGVKSSVVAGVAVAVIALVAIVLIVFVYLVRRGVIHPVERLRTVRRAVTMTARNVYRSYGELGRRGRAQTSMAYSKAGTSRQSELYIYGGMDINGPDIKHIDRREITFKSVLKDGHFAKIYIAGWKQSGMEETVVAKTLKENFTSDDENQMKARISFTGTVVGDHPNVLKFLGAVTGNEAMGPFIIYEYCENGTLKEYLVAHKRSMSIELQESLFKFGLDIAKGMEYLASKKIVHRRLAARNILLTFLNEVKIAGFGPQPDEEMEADSSKQERIPVKWMPPECMSTTRDATEKSDVWSYAIVLWEDFSLGDTPYEDIRSTDLPAKLKKGYRLPKPEQCDDTWYGVMKKCWSFEPSERPTFNQIRDELNDLFTTTGEEFYYMKR